MRKFKKLSLILSLVMIFTALFSGTVFAAPRLYGENRIETAIKIAEAGWPNGADTVIIAAGLKSKDAAKTATIFADALAGAPLAAALDAPILLVDANPNVDLDLRVRAALLDLAPSKVVVLGGPEAVSEAVVEQIKADLGLADDAVVRIQGKNRYETSAAIAKAVAELTGADEALVVDGLDFGEALAVASYAAKFGVPVVYREGLVDLDEVVVDGDIYELSAEYAAKFEAPAKVLLATGKAFADAFAAAPYAAKINAPVVLVGDELSEAAADFLASVAGAELEVLGGPNAVSEAIVADAEEAMVVEEELAIKSVAAVKANTIAVTFNKAVDTSKVSFTVKKGSSSVQVDAPVWNDEKTVAHLVRTSANYSEGEYTVEVNGLDKKLTGTVTIAAQKVAAIEFLGDTLIKSANGNSATFGFVVKDQYGTDITSKANLTAISSLGSSYAPTLNYQTGTGTINYNFAADVNLKYVTVTLVDSVTGVNKTATLNVVAAATVASMEFGDVILPVDKTRIQTGLSTAASVPVTVYDQYGNLIKDITVLNGALNLLSSEPGRVVFTFVSDENGNPQINIDTTNLSEAKTVVLTAVSTANGAAYTKLFEIAKPAEPKAVIAIGDFNKANIAEGDTGIVFEITVVDQFGNELSKSDIVANKDAIEDMVDGGGSVISEPTIITDRNSGDYGKMQFNALRKGYATIVAASTTAVVTKNVVVGDPRVVNRVTAPANVNLMQGASAGLGFSYFDQYGDQMYGMNDNPATTYKVEVTKVSGDNDAVVVNVQGDPNKLVGTDERVVFGNIRAIAAANKTGSYKVTLSLLDANNPSNVVSSATVIVKVVKNDVAGLTYYIKDLPKLPGNTNYDKTSKYAGKIQVEAKDANGNVYVINPADIYSVSVWNNAYAGVDLDNGTWKVFGKNITGSDINPDWKDLTATVTVKINTLNGLVTATKDVTISPNGPWANELRPTTGVFQNWDEGGVDWRRGDLPTWMAPTKSTYEATQAQFESGINFYMAAKDGYDMWSMLSNAELANATVVVNSTDKAAVNAFAFDDQGHLKLVNATGLVKNQDIKATILYQGASTQIIINVK